MSLATVNLARLSFCGIGIDALLATIFDTVVTPIRTHALSNEHCHPSLWIAERYRLWSDCGTGLETRFESLIFLLVCASTASLVQVCVGTILIIGHEMMMISLHLMMMLAWNIVTIKPMVLLL